jgi:squalene-hopene/tetraprenyl-beta-curcumene cyclase
LNADRLRQSLDRARGFIVEAAASAQPPCWSDFRTLAGESVDWVSGYVGYNLALSLPPGGAAGGTTVLPAVASGILGRQHGDGGWGYGPIVPSDADSTSWCLLFLSRMDALDPGRLERAAAFLSRHQSPVDGGFRTYAAPREIGRFMRLDGEGLSFEGWASSQTCVTASAALALARTGALRGSRDRALDYIRSSQTPDGRWNAYWWADPLYSTALCMEALVAEGQGGVGGGDVSLVERAQSWMAETQDDEGCWNAGGWAFSTALGLRGLLLGPRDRTTAIERAAEWLVAHQLEDGGWSERHILRIPHPSDREPWLRAGWTADGRAIGAAIRDQRRLFTTATALRALSEFQERVSGRAGPSR